MRTLLVLAACTGFLAAATGCGKSETEILTDNAKIASSYKQCDKCGLASIPEKHKCGTTAYCGPCLAKCQTDKKAWPGEVEYSVEGDAKLAKCKVCGQQSMGAKK